MSDKGFNLSDRINLIIPTERIERQVQLSVISTEMTAHVVLFDNIPQWGGIEQI